MQSTPSPSKVAQPFLPVKSGDPITANTSPASMIHHKVPELRIVGTTLKDIEEKGKRYGVSSSHKVLTKGLFLKKYDLVVNCLAEVCGLTPAERDEALQLLRLQVYYPRVYPKASQVASDTGHGVATFWRTVGKLQDKNLLEVVHRFLIRVEAQISNLYLLDRLLIVIARYLAEHGTAFLEKWLQPYLSMPGRLFWGQYRIVGVEGIKWKASAAYGE